MQQNSLLKQRVSRREKEKLDFQWYKDSADYYDTYAFSNSNFENSIDAFDDPSYGSRSDLKTNYDLYNNIINKYDFERSCKAYGSSKIELPDHFVNRDILSPKIKRIEGLYNKRPFIWKVLAVNEEATTRKEQEKFRLIKEYVVNSIIEPLKKELMEQKMQQTQGKELTPQQQQQIQK